LPDRACLQPHSARRYFLVDSIDHSTLHDKDPSC
jgi:hypothetical protein